MRTALRSIGGDDSFGRFELERRREFGATSPIGRGRIAQQFGCGLRSIEAPEPLTRRSAPTSPDERGETGQAASAIVARLWLWAHSRHDGAGRVSPPFPFYAGKRLAFRSQPRTSLCLRTPGNSLLRLRNLPCFRSPLSFRSVALGHRLLLA